MPILRRVNRIAYLETSCSWKSIVLYKSGIYNARLGLFKIKIMQALIAIMK